MIKINGKKVAGIGQPGLNGKSAYETAKEGGFTGTEQEFNEIDVITKSNMTLYFFMIFLNYIN